jgi:site-specific recombinase XerD
MSKLTLKDLKNEIDEFLEFKRALGSPYVRGESTLRNFQRFIERREFSMEVTGDGIDLRTAIAEWISSKEDRKAVTISLYLGVVRQLCLYRRRRDPNSYVPECAMAPQTESRHFPHIFSEKEIRQILTAALRHQGRNIWSEMLYTLILLSYCTGIRFGEAVRLNLNDVDQSQFLLTIRESKGRTRFVPYGTDVSEKLEAYLKKRLQIFSSRNIEENDSFFIRLDGTPLPVDRASVAVTNYLGSWD